MSSQFDLFTTVQPTSVSPAIVKPFVSRSTFYQGDCLVEMDKIADKSVDMILCDLPYGTTQNKWDSVLPLDLLWVTYKRVLKDAGCVILTADGIFTGTLIMSNPKWFKYKLVWDKKSTSGFLNARVMPLRRHEDILIFAKGKTAYNPIMEVRGEPRKKGGYVGGNKGTYGNYDEDIKFNNEYYPTSIIEVSNANQKEKVHPTQKPVELMEYLVKTYTNEGETVLDNCMGSGTTGVACKKTGRHFIGIEKDEKYFEIAVSRVSAYCG